MPPDVDGSSTVDRPTILDRPLPYAHEGVPVMWPLSKIWLEIADEELEYGQGLPARFLEHLTPAECIEVAGEATLYEACQGCVLETRLQTLLAAHAACAAPWARGFADRLSQIRSDDGPRARGDAPSFQHLGIYDWDVLGIVALLPLVRANTMLEPHWDRIVPFGGPRDLVREILLALPPERREAIVYHRLMTNWGAEAATKALNDFTVGFALLDLAPSFRVARILVQKFRNCRSHFSRSKEQITARFTELAAKHPEVARALKPQRAVKRPNAAGA
jgi:hypothetical protein